MYQQKDDIKSSFKTCRKDLFHDLFEATKMYRVKCTPYNVINYQRQCL